ncbi:MAG: COX15/CtaA family protein [Gammaproteobacteria bacterium]
MANQYTLVYRLSLFALLLAGVVVLLGAYTRLVDAGLGCPDWPGCYGFLSVPDSHEEIQQAEAMYPHAPVESDKAWPEMVHRYFAGSLGLVIALLALVAIKSRHDPGVPLTLPLLLAALVVFQAALGMWTVTLGLLPVVVMGHLLGGFATLSLLLLLFLKIRDQNSVASPSVLRTLAIIGLIIVVIQITLGGWTSANYAAIICTDFPTCQGLMLPPLDFIGAFQLHTEGVDSYLGGHLGNDARVTIHWMHRLGALLTTLYLVFLHVKLMQAGYKKLALWLMLVLVVQITLGISNVVYSLPLVVAVAHNGVAALLLLTMVTITHRVGRPGV